MKKQRQELAQFGLVFCIKFFIVFLGSLPNSYYMSNGTGYSFYISSTCGYLLHPK